MGTSQVSMLMKDDSESTSGRETILDYELSWVLRMAAEPSCPPLLKRQCRHILLTLINEKDSNDEILEVKTWKQWNNVDLIADIYVKKNGVTELHVLLVEDKAYTSMKENQRDDYPIIVREAYDTYECYKQYRGKYILHPVLITCFEADSPGYNKLSNFIANSLNEKWSIFSVGNLPDGKELTESDLFNEFWLKSW